VNVAIHDANILIDIVKLDLADALFSLDLSMRTTDAVWAELSGDQKRLLQPFVDGNLLAIDSFTAEEVRQIVSYAQKHRALSFEDCSLLLPEEGITHWLSPVTESYGQSSNPNSSKFTGFCGCSTGWLMSRLSQKSWPLAS
jgi:hypothetical protein